MQSTFLAFDFEWSPIQNYLNDRGIDVPHSILAGLASDQLPSHAVYDWVVRNHSAVIDGLQLGEYYRVSDYGIAGLALLSADTFSDALKVARAYMSLFNPDITGIRIDPGNAQGELRIATSPITNPGWSIEQCQFHANVLASAAYHLFCSVMGHPPKGLALTLPAGLKDTHPYEEYFKAPVRTYGSDIVYNLPANILDLAIPTANPSVFQSALGQASDNFNKLFDREIGGIRRRVIALLASLPERYPSIQQTAQYLRLTERTLRRRLTEEGSSYREILDEARLQRAQELLRRSQLSTEQVAELLGYSDASSLRQAFRRWTGVSVNEYRQCNRDT
ncbi:helix-turn-helix domain-containing protein [Pseudomonas poae]|nr:helix-turn-helix domain-containing protein [Pseudomonas poae]